MESTIVMRGTNSGVKIRLPKSGSVTVVSKGKITNVEAKGSTAIKFAA